eukprot:g1548.t1
MFHSEKSAEDIVRTISETLKGADASVSKATSVYWWKGRVENDEEFRISFDCDAEMYRSSGIAEAIAKVHNYEVPMILAIREEEEEEEEASYWKGTFETASGEEALAIATELVRARLVACAQIAGVSGSTRMIRADLKTTDGIKRDGRIQSILAKAIGKDGPPVVSWSPVAHGNAAYLRWIDDEIRMEDS